MKVKSFICILLMLSLSFQVAAQAPGVDPLLSDKNSEDDSTTNFKTITPPGETPELSKEDRAILVAGPITRKKYITGGILGSTVGFGTGHVVVGKWKESGWLYTAAELGFLGLMVVGYKKNLSETLSSGFNGNFDGSNYAIMITGYVGFISSRIGEIFDIWSRPYEHNERYRELTGDNPLANLNVYPLISPQNVGLGMAYAF